MASITTNGVVLEVPYAIIRNIQNARPWTLAVTGRDPRSIAYNKLQLRTFPRSPSDVKNDIFVYKDDTVTFDLQAPANAADALAYELYSVNFTTGAETKVAQIGFNKVWQKQVKIAISAINASTGAITYTTSWS